MHHIFLIHSLITVLILTQVHLSIDVSSHICRCFCETFPFRAYSCFTCSVLLFYDVYPYICTHLRLCVYDQCSLYYHDFRSAPSLSSIVAAATFDPNCGYNCCTSRYLWILPWCSISSLLFSLLLLSSLFVPLLRMSLLVVLTLLLLPCVKLLYVFLSVYIWIRLPYCLYTFPFSPRK